MVTLPIHVDVKTGALLPPSEAPAYTGAVWCVGSYDTMSEARRAKYAERIRDLKGKLKHLNDLKEAKRGTN